MEAQYTELSEQAGGWDDLRPITLRTSLCLNDCCIFTLTDGKEP